VEPRNREIDYRRGQRIVAVPIGASGAEPAYGKPTAPSLTRTTEDPAAGATARTCPQRLGG